MGDAKDDIGLFSTWSMGFFGPFVFSNSLERALLFNSELNLPKEQILQHQAFIRILMTYVQTKDDPIIPDNYDPFKELTYMNKIARKLLEHPESLCYFNPNGEVLLSKEQFNDKLLHFQK